MVPRATALALVALAACTNPEPCPRPLEACVGQCVDVQSDPHHCGICGAVCGAGQVCVGGRCSTDVQAACPDRTGGAFVTLRPCDDEATVKLWIRRADFVDEAAAYVGTTGVPRTPELTIVAGSDCDGQWSWHVSETTPQWVTAATPGCDVLCPAIIQLNAGAFAGRRWCPTPGPRLVLAVERR